MTPDPAAPTSAYGRSIEDHYRTIWRPPFGRERLRTGPISTLSDDFGVLAIRQAAGTTAHATVCMSQPDDEERLELHMLSRGDQVVPSLVEILTAVAYYHRTGSRLGHGQTVNFGVPWMPQSGCTFGLISLPYLDGPKLEWMDKPRVRFLWLIPITEAEREFKKTHGLEALEERFERSSFNYLDPLRPSVV